MDPRTGVRTWYRFVTHCNALRARLRLQDLLKAHLSSTQLNTAYGLPTQVPAL